MNEEKRRQTRNWIHKSRSDLGSARRLLEGPEAYPDTAVYHCQQAVEKILKAFLTWHDIPFARTHDLTELVRLAEGVNRSFGRWESAAQELTPYAVQFRYPGDLLEPERADVDHALQQATALIEFVLGLLPDEVKPS
ncbi:MAG: HEPN domain-containing protein [Anaerolineae bacterium]|nr:HEPN domain-containing protein [Anaerolineae bacterium]